MAYDTPFPRKGKVYDAAAQMCAAVFYVGGDLYRDQNPQRDPQLPREHLFRAQYPAIRLLIAGAWRGGGPLFLPAAHRRRRAGGLDVHPWRCAVCRLRIFQLPRHDGGTAAVGVDQIRDSYAQTVGVQVRLPVLPDYAARHCRGL